MSGEFGLPDLRPWTSDFRLKGEGTSGGASEARSLRVEVWV